MARGFDGLCWHRSHARVAKAAALQGRLGEGVIAVGRQLCAPPPERQARIARDAAAEGAEERGVGRRREQLVTVRGRDGGPSVRAEQLRGREPSAREAMEGDGRPWKAIGGHGRRWKAKEGEGRRRKAM